MWMNSFLSQIYFVCHQNGKGFLTPLLRQWPKDCQRLDFNHVQGVKDLIAHGVTGLLTDCNGLGQTLHSIMNNHHLRLKMGQRARRFIAHYAPIETFGRWGSLLKQLE